MKTPQCTNTTKKKQETRFTILSDNEEDLLDWDAAITMPPPRRSGTIRV